ncbi:unnamed protein product [Rodentolepis nana]|uniref:ORF16 n=1 Tax=Rodentolepis nana TaxID=102285 RepID=A0A0R3T8S4_RODNA|nr:unnamed protein product [Rodentolepis nana]
MAESCNHSVSGVPHIEFDPSEHDHLYIDLDNLGTHYMHTLQPETGVPLFLYVAMEMLTKCAMSRQTDLASSYVNLIANTNTRFPTVYNPACKICYLVAYLYRDCKDEEEAKETLLEEETITVFEVNRELWTRIRPKPLYINKHFLRYVDYIDYPMALLSEEFRYPLEPQKTHRYDLLRKKFYLFEWRDGFSYLTYYAIVCGGKRGKAAGYILGNMMFLVQYHLATYFKDDMDIAEAHYILEKLRLYPGSHSIISKLCKVIGIAICELELEYETKSFVPTPFYEIRGSDWYKSEVTNCVATILSLNNCFAFKPEWPVDFSFTHTPDCSTRPHLCFCRFIKFLERTYRFHYMSI